MVFLLLGAPDLAIVQVVVETLTLVMLLRVVVTREDATLRHAYRHGTAPAAAVAPVFLGAFLVFAWISFQDLAPFGSPLMTVSRGYLERTLSEVNAPNFVTAVLLDYRAYDTLGEATVIFTAIIGALAVLRKKGRRSHERDDADR
ncbi:MAG: hydrogen gas-evolving membrane-bound hydrogenase subunit E [Planctomycetota bacterium]